MNFLRRSALYVYYRFLRLKDSPEEIARGLGIGVLMGFTPTLGIQTISAIFVAAIFKGNKFLAALGAGITNPLTIPFFYTGTYKIGSAVLGNPLDFSFLSHPTFQDFWSIGNDLFLALWVGGLIVGIPSGIIFYFLGLWAAPRLIKQYAKAKNRFRNRKTGIVG
jgi:uncharacterized protein (DUF2062 family)